MKKIHKILIVVGLVIIIIAGIGIFSFQTKLSAFLPGNRLYQLKNISETIYPYFSLNTEGRYSKEKIIFDNHYSSAADIYSQKLDKLYQPAIASLNNHLEKLNNYINKISDQSRKVEYQKDLAEKSFLVLNLIDQMRGHNTNILQTEVESTLAKTNDTLGSLPEADRNTIVEKNSAIVNSLIKNDPTLATKVDSKIKEIAANNNPETTSADLGTKTTGSSAPSSAVSINSLSKDQVENIVKSQVKGNSYIIKATNVLKSSGQIMIGLVVNTDYPTFIYAINQTSGVSVVAVSAEDFVGIDKPSNVSDSDWQWLLHYSKENAKDGDINFK